MWIATITLLLALKVIPSIDAGNAIAYSVQSPWYQYGMTVYLTHVGRIDTSIFGYFFSNPGSYLTETTLTLLAGIKLSQPDFLLNYFEFFIDVLALVCMYFAVSQIWKIPVFQRWIIIWLFTIGMYVGIESTPDVALSYIIFLVVLGLVIPTPTDTSLSSIIILFAAIALVNTLASVMVFFLLVSFGFAFGRSRRLVILSFLAMVASIAWLVYAAQPALASIGSSLTGNYLNLALSLFSRSFSQKVSFGSEAHVLGYTIEVYSVLALILVAALATSYFLYKERGISTPIKILVVMAVADLVFFILTSGVYHSELPIRFYVFLMPAVFFAISELAKIRKLTVVIILCIVILVPVNLIVVSGNYENYLSQSDLATFHFMYDEYPAAANIVSRFYIAQVDYVPQPAETTYLGDQSFLVFSNGTGSVVDFYQNICSGNFNCPGILNGKPVNTTRPLIVTVTDFDRLSYKWDNQTYVINSVQLNLTLSHNFDLVYKNQASEVFVSDSYNVG